MSDGDVVLARRWGKFFNHGERGADLPTQEPVEVTDKQDGSLGIVHPVPDGWAVATRDAVDSEQALHATALLRTCHGEWSPPAGWTYLVEIVYPGNRVVLLGAVEIATGPTRGPGELRWPGRWTSTLAAGALREALALVPRRNAEGVVVRCAALPVLHRERLDRRVPASWVDFGAAQARWARSAPAAARCAATSVSCFRGSPG